MADTRMKISTGDVHDQDEAPPITIRATFGMRRRISLLCELGVCGTTVEEVCERLVCQKLMDLEMRDK